MAEVPGMRLMEFLETRQESVMDREEDNLRSIHLYGMGKYWVAFEHSAYLLCRTFPLSETSVVRFAAHPFPVVMASIADWELRSCSMRHVLRTVAEDYKVLSVPELSRTCYGQWHRMAVREEM